MLTVYKASAGSGKTYTLAKNYITLLLGIKNELTGRYSLNLAHDADGASHTPRLKHNNRHRAILAITFTRKATEEMKTRIISELERLAACPDNPEHEKSPYAADLIAEMQCSREQLSATATIALRQLLFDYQNFNVSTIDAFFQRVLHAFARELDRQSDYNVELDDRAAMQAAVGAMLDDFNASSSKGSPLEAWLYDFMTTQIGQGRKANFFNRRSKAHTNLVALLAQISSEKFKPYSRDMEKYLEGNALGQFTQALAAYKRGLLQQIKDEAEAVFLNPDSPIDLANLGTAKAAKMVEDMLKGMPVSKLSEFASSKHIIAMVDPQADQFAFKKGKGTDEQSLAVKRFYERAYANHLRYFAIKPIHDALTQIGLLKHAWGYLRQLTKENNLLLISDTNQLLKRIIGEDETPFIYERMGVQLHHFLIDEFQDTSKMQWDNLRPLVLNSLAEQHDNLVIGDEKQSIYRFRNSDSSILHSQLQQEFGSRIVPKGTAPKENTNYRSSCEVVKFNNTLFSIMAQIESLPGFENVAQDIKKEYRDFHGYVRFMPVEKKRTTKDESAEADESAENAEDMILSQMAAEILRMTNDGKYDFKDIVVLVDTNAQATTAVNYLVTNFHDQIPVLSDEALHLASSWAVQLVISVLKIIDQEESATGTEPEKPSKYLSRSEVLKVLNLYEYYSSQEGISQTEAIQLATSTSPDAALAQGIEAVRSRRPSSLVSMIETVIATQFPKPEVRAAHSAYLSALQDVALDFVASTNGSLHAFLDWWADNSARLSIGGDSEANAVRVMTIHKSKGLEFPCVLIPFCKWSLTWDDPHKTPKIWAPLNQYSLPEGSLQGLDLSCAPPALYITLDENTRFPQSPFAEAYNQERAKALVDTVNKTYVAFTRAKAELIAWYQPGEKLIGGLIQRAIEQGLPKNANNASIDVMLDLREHYHPDGNLTIGEPTVKERVNDSKGTADASCLPIQYDAVCRPDVLSITTIDDPRELDKDIDNQLIESISTPTPQLLDGIYLHDIMAHIRKASDMESAVKKVGKKNRLSPDKMREYSEVIGRFIADRRTAHWWEGYSKVYIEQPIYIPNADAMRRPDRVVVHPDGSVAVIDYKFTDEGANAVSGEHLDQVREYMSLLRAMGYRKVKGYLAYPRLNEVIEVADNQLSL